MYLHLTIKIGVKYKPQILIFIIFIMSKITPIKSKQSYKTSKYVFKGDHNDWGEKEKKQKETRKKKQEETRRKKQERKREEILWKIENDEFDSEDSEIETYLEEEAARKKKIYELNQTRKKNLMKKKVAKKKLKKTRSKRKKSGKTHKKKKGKKREK